MSYEEKRFCVYLHKRKDNGEVFYVGQGTETRSSSKSSRNAKWTTIATEIGFDVEIVISGITKEQALSIETETIEQYRSTIINSLTSKSNYKEMDFELFNSLFVVDGTAKSGLRVKTQRGRAVVGTDAGCVNAHGYCKVAVGGKIYCAHRVVYLLVNGNIDSNQVIDHIDGNKLNNNISNLRLVTQSKNIHNRKMMCSNTTGVEGVSLDICNNSYRASIRVSPGKVLQAGFSVNKYGKECAFALAIAWRKNKELLTGRNKFQGDC